MKPSMMAPSASAALVALALAAAALPGAAGAAEGRASISGVQKVIQMLTDMSAKSKQEKAAAEVAFAKFSTWCSQEIPSLQGDIKKNGEQIESLGARIDKLGSDVKTLGKDIAELSNKAATAEADLKAEKEQRATDHEAFAAESKDYEESISALERAIAVLQKQAYDRAGTQAALLQISQNEQLPAKAKTIIAAFVDVMAHAKRKEDPDYMSYDAPEAKAYEFQSGNIVDLLKRLMSDFKAKLSECQKEEMNSKHASEMVVMDLTDSVENAKKHFDSKTIEKMRKAEHAAKDKKQLSATVSVKAENQKTLEATETECSENKASFEEKQRLRAEEIEAIEKAVEILSSPEVAGAAEKHLGLVQLRPSGASALVQLAGSQGNAGGSEGINRRVREFLLAEGNRLHSQRLGLLAKQLASDPFGKVKKMIEDLISRLQEEAHGDAEHEGFCDKELGKSKITRDELTGQIDQLSAAVDDGKATISSLSQSVAALSQEIADLTKATAEATTLRQEESKTNAATLKDAQSAQVAVEAAVAVLKEFYDKASVGSALLQVQQVQQDAANGVLGLLEVIQSDFANLEANTRAAETEGQRTYDMFMAESKKSQAVKERKIELSKEDKASAEAKLQEDTADLKATQDQLLAAERYYDKLKPQCIDSGMTYEDRHKARQEEIRSLREALEILSGEDIATSAL